MPEAADDAEATDGAMVAMMEAMAEVEAAVEAMVEAKDVEGATKTAPPPPPPLENVERGLEHVFLAEPRKLDQSDEIITRLHALEARMASINSEHKMLQMRSCFLSKADGALGPVRVARGSSPRHTIGQLF